MAAKSAVRPSFLKNRSLSLALLPFWTTSTSDIASADKLILTTEKDFQRLIRELKRDFPMGHNFVFGVEWFLGLLVDR